MNWFTFSRSEGFPTQYPSNKTAVTVDVLDAGFICAFVILLLCFLLSLLTPRLKNNINLFVRTFFSLIIGLFIIISNFGQEWEIAHIKSKTPYRVGTGEEINADIGLYIGLRSINVTLKSSPGEKSVFAKEEINYNERFEWTWDQGRLGFGPYAGHLQQQFRAAQYKGLPLPILWIVDYFVIDGEGFRFGRFYRTAGWYTHILLWTAFPCWLLANIFFRSVIRYGAYFLGMCGALLLFGNLLWLIIRNPNPLVIPFEEATIVTSFGFHYWLTFTTGILCLILAVVVLYFEANYDVAISIFFGVDPLTALDEFILTPEEFDVLRKKNIIPQDSIPLSTMNESSASSPSDESSALQTVFLKRKTHITLGKAAKLRRKYTVTQDDEQPIYGNMDTIRNFEDQV